MGYCRFDAKDDRREVSIAIDPEFHDKGMGYLLLSNSIKKLRNKENVVATVKLDNKKSLALFEKNGFHIIKKEKNVYHLVYQQNKLSPRIGC